MTAPLITNFEAMDHATLLATLAGMRGDLIYESGDRLAAASRKILSAARTLQLKREGVVWEGPAAAAFHEWSQQLVTSAYQLADFARFQGSQLHTAGAEMTSTVNSFPPVPTEAVETLQALTTHNATAMALDPVGTTTAMQQQETLIEQERREAIGAMRRLASTYLAVRDSIGAYPRPQFHQAANVHGVSGFADDPDDYGGGVGLVSAFAAGAAGQTSLAGETSSGSATNKSGTPAPNAGPWSASSATGTTLPVGGPASYPPGALPRSANLAQVPAAQTSTAQVPPPDQGAPPRTSPTTGLDAVSPKLPSGGGGISGGTVVATTAPGTAGPSGIGVPLHGVSGAVSGGVVRTGAPNKAATTSAKPPTGRSAPRVDGVMGGTTRPGHAVPEEGRVGGGRLGAPIGGTAPVTGGTASRPPTRRPPLGVPGGPVAGTPRSTTPGGRREFTAGGSGLRTRNATNPQGAPPAANGTVGRPVSGMVGAQQPARPNRSRRSRARADYLEEAEETWVGRRGDTVPPVIA